jgi:histidyl-tRNA synthetase
MDPVVTPTLVRGLDYYTRTAFEFVSEVMTQAQASLFAGGRYDGLAEALGGPHVPGVGFGMGLERVLLALKDEGLGPPGEPPLEVFVVPVDRVGRDTSYELLRQLRALGVSAAWALEDRSLKAQLRMADRSGARFALLVGEREVQDGAVTVRRLSDGHQHTVPTTDVAAWFAETERE